jgi:hypothetical protein
LLTSAGGQDDGYGANGGLLTVGGLDDSHTNPDPYAPATDIRTDDELYDLLPFVETGDTSITVYTVNPSNDDNIFFASLFLASTTAVVGEGIVLAPASATNEVGTSHTVTATVQDDDGNPIVGRNVTFTIISGPHAGLTGTTPTNDDGQAEFTYTGTLVGTDVIEASFVDSHENTITSNEVTKEWIKTNTNDPPDVNGAYPSVSSLLVSNHKWVDIQILGVTDSDGDEITITITGITQDEPTLGTGSGDTCPDGKGIGTNVASVRAERDGSSDGRVYKISFNADDGNGGVTSGSVNVSVPKSLAQKKNVVDSGQLYDSTLCN